MTQGAQRSRQPRYETETLAAWRLVDLLIKRGDVDGLQARALAGDGIAQSRSHVLKFQCSEDDLRARADAGDQAAERTLWLLAYRTDLDGVRARRDRRNACRRLAGPSAS